MTAKYGFYTASKSIFWLRVAEISALHEYYQQDCACGIGLFPAGCEYLGKSGAREYGAGEYSQL
jgi:hypothetical protein